MLLQNQEEDVKWILGYEKIRQFIREDFPSGKQTLGWARLKVQTWNATQRAVFG